MQPSTRWVVVIGSLVALALGLAAWGAALMFVAIPLAVAPEGYTLEQLYAQGVPIPPTPIVLAIWPGPLVACAVLIGVRGAVKPRPARVGRFVGTALVLMGTIMVLSLGVLWAAGFAVADYFSATRHGLDGPLFLTAFGGASLLIAESLLRKEPARRSDQAA